MFSVLRGRQFDYGQASLTKRLGFELRLNGEASVSWLVYVGSIGHVLEIPDGEMSSTEMNTEDIQVVL